MPVIKHATFLFLVYLSLCRAAWSQETNPGAELMQLKVNLFQPAIEYEVGLSQASTIVINPELGFGFLPVKQDFTQINKWHYFLVPILEAQYRYYYNFSKRKEKGKRISGNSGNFIGWRLAGTTSPLADNLPVFTGMHFYTGPFWGMQRTYASNFCIGYNIGIAYFINEFGSKFITPFGELSIGFNIYKKQ